MFTKIIAKIPLIKLSINIVPIVLSDAKSGPVNELIIICLLPRVKYPE